MRLYDRKKFCRRNLHLGYNRSFDELFLNLQGAFDDTTCVQWSPCSRIVAVGAKDNTTRIYALQRFKNFKVYCLGGHNEPIVRVFFDKDFRVYTLSR